jgi:hypothetical protein
MLTLSCTPNKWEANSSSCTDKALAYSHLDQTYTCTQKYWVSGLGPSSGILNTRKHNVSETGSVSVLREVRHLLCWSLIKS